MSKKESKLTLTRAREVVKALGRLDLENADYEIIKNHVANFRLGVPLQALRFNSGNGLFRARVTNDKPFTLEKLMEPPAEKVVDFQRCNPPGKPVFYCADHPITACFEIEAKAGDTVYVARWSTSKPFYMAQVQQPTEGQKPVSATVSTFIETVFIKRVHKTFSSEYKITSAIADVFMDENWTVSFDDGGPPDEAAQFGQNAIEYPSAAHPKHQRCYALRPHIVRECLTLDYVEELQIIEVTLDGLKMESTDIASSVESGEIVWSGKGKHWTLDSSLVGKTVTFSQEYEGPVARLEDGTVIKPG